MPSALYHTGCIGGKNIEYFQKERRIYHRERCHRTLTAAATHCLKQTRVVTGCKLQNFSRWNPKLQNLENLEPGSGPTLTRVNMVCVVTHEREWC